MIILLPNRTSQVRAETRMIMIKNKLKYTNRRITHMIILPTNKMSQF